MKFELNEQQQKTVLSIIANAQIMGKDAPAILDLAKALQTPVKCEPKPEAKKEPTK